MAYEDRDVINNPSIYAEMVQKSGQSLSPCVEVNGHMLADVSGDEVEAYLLKAGVVQPTARECSRGRKRVPHNVGHLLWKSRPLQAGRLCRRSCLVHWSKVADLLRPVECGIVAL